MLAYICRSILSRHLKANILIDFCSLTFSLKLSDASLDSFNGFKSFSSSKSWPINCNPSLVLLRRYNITIILIQNHPRLFKDALLSKQTLFDVIPFLLVPHPFVFQHVLAAKHIFPILMNARLFCCAPTSQTWQLAFILVQLTNRACQDPQLAGWPNSMFLSHHGSSVGRASFKRYRDAATPTLCGFESRPRHKVVGKKS